MMPKEAKRSVTSPLLLGGALTLSLVVAVVIGLNMEGESSGNGSPETPTADHLDEEQRAWGQSLARRTADDPMALGDEDAPVVLVAYSDFACPFCASWAQETQPELIERYVGTGDLRIEWREFPYLGDQSRTLSVGALAAAEQDAFWPYQEAVFDSQDDLKSASQPHEVLGAIADDIGLDVERFETDLGDEELAQEVDEGFLEGQQTGVSGTPAFIINGDPVMGAQPLDVFVESIDSALASAGG